MKRLNVALAALAILLAASTTVGATMVANGGFELGDFTGWTQSGNTGIAPPGYTQVTGYSGDVHTGGFAAKMGPEGSEGSLSQDLVTTPGQWYSVSFWLKNDGAPNNIFNVYWSGSPIFNGINLPSAPYTQYSYLEQATSSTTTIGFSFRNDPGFFCLDDISVSPVPLPGTLMLMGSGLSGLVGIARWRRRK